MHDRRRNPGISSHLKLEQHSQPSKKEVQYRLEINWTDDRQVQEQLKLLQCVANFEGSTHPCRTPVVIVDFVEVSNPGMLKFIYTIIINYVISQVWLGFYTSWCIVRGLQNYN